MSETLTHNQIEDMLQNLTQDKVSGVQAMRLGEEFAALRALLRQREEEIESLKVIQGIDLKNNNVYRQEVIDLRAQLAAMTAERDALKGNT